MQAIIGLCLAVCLSLSIATAALDQTHAPSLLPSEGIAAGSSNATSTTSTNETTSVCPDDLNQVSWQSALWGVIALSLNAMTQRSGADRFPSSDSLSPARSSPFVCIAELLVAVLWLVRGLRLGLSVKGALRWYRKEMGLVRDKADRELVQGIPAVTICFFVLGPLPQAVKMFGVAGLPWTKAWAVIFFTAWVGEVVMRFFAGLAVTAGDVQEGGDVIVAKGVMCTISRLFHQLAFLIQVAVWLWILVSLALSKGARVYFGGNGCSLRMDWFMDRLLVAVVHAADCSLILGDDDALIRTQGSLLGLRTIVLCRRGSGGIMVLLV